MYRTVATIRILSTQSGDFLVKVRRIMGVSYRAMLTRTDDSDALITKVTIATHPDLNIPRHFKMDVLPSPEMSQQSVTINLPSTHYYIQVSPIVARHVVNRQHKLFLTVNGQRLQSMPKIQGGVMDRESQVFVARLIPGVNRIELEIIAALPKGAVKGVNGSDVELEKFNIFANLLK